MGSDRARVSHDASRHWRAVVSQQGRVALEADANEATAIAIERERAELLDIVGPAGAPLGAPGTPGAYTVTPVAAGSGAFTGDFAVSPGTLYVGGERIVLDRELTYGSQPDWLDTAGDPLWVAPAIPGAASGAGDNEIVYLLLREQEVGAVEDPALRDVALGGPDTTARTRIVQRIVRQATDQASARAPFSDSHLVGTLASLGLAFDPATMSLRSAARLQVQGDFVGAENQLVRVQVASVDATGVPTLVWGFDNAYDLYVVTPESAGAQTATTFTLASAPVDVFHQPAAGQAVEILQSAAQLNAGEPNGHIAAPTGIVTTLAPTGGYQPDTQQVVLSSPIPVPVSGAPPLFMRVWQGTVVYSGQPTPLGDTGLQVTVELDPAPPGVPASAYHVGDYWIFAVRPGTSSPILPERISQSSQPPDGPRMWACPLALVAWVDQRPTVTDLRRSFDNLVDTLAALTSTDLQGKNFPLALLRLFGRGVVSGLIPSISVTPPTSGATTVEVSVTVTGGTVVDGRGAVVSPPSLSLDTTVPLAFSGPGVITDAKQWLYVVTDAAEAPSLQLRTTPPVGVLNVPADVAQAIANPASGPVVPPNATCSDSETAAWQMYSDIPSVDPSNDPAVCLGVIGVQGGAGWTAPDDRQQLFPTPAIAAALWRSQRQSVYAAIKAACIAAPVNLEAIMLGQSNLSGQALLGGTAGRTATVVLDGPVRGSALTVNFQSSAGVTVHGPIAILPGNASGQVRFDITAGSGAQSITAVIDTGQLQASFTAVHVQALTLAGGATAVMSGDPIGVTVALSSPATEALTVALTAPNTTFTPATVQIPATSGTGQGQLTVLPPASGTVQITGSVHAADGTTGTAPPALQFQAVALSGLTISPPTVTIGTPSTGTVSLSGPAPYGIQIAIVVADQTVLTAAPTLLTVAQGATSVQSFQLTGVAVGSTTVTASRSAGGQVRQSLSTTVTVQPKPKETKEGKDAKDQKDGKEGKDTKDGKEHKDGKEDKDGIKDTPFAAEKTHPDVTPSPAEDAVSQDDGPKGPEPPVGRAFVTPTLRPTLGAGAFDPPEEEGR